MAHFEKDINTIKPATITHLTQLVENDKIIHDEYEVKSRLNDIKKELLDAYFDSEKMYNDWWEGLRFLLDRSFYQGRADHVSIRVNEAAMKVLDPYFKGRDIARTRSQWCSIYQTERHLDYNNKTQTGQHR